MNEIDLLKQVQGLGRAGKIFQKKDAQALIDILLPDEQLIAILNGRWLNEKKLPIHGFIITTNKRLILMKKTGMFTGSAFEVYPFEKVSSVEYTFGSAFRPNTIVIYASGNKTEVTTLQKEASEFIQIVKDLLNHNKNSINEKELSKDLINQLERLANLRKNGDITENEYETLKAKLISDVSSSP